MARRLQSYTNETLTVTFAPDRCIHAAVCVRRVPRVFAPRERPWIRLEHGDAEAIADAVAGRPTGALQLRWADGAAPVTPAEDVRESEPKAALLVQLQRDGTHTRIGFRSTSAEAPDSTDGRRSRPSP